MKKKPSILGYPHDLGTPKSYMGVSENSVPLNPMVNDPYPY